MSSDNNQEEGWERWKYFLTIMLLIYAVSMMIVQAYNILFIQPEIVQSIEALNHTVQTLEATQ